MLNGLPDEDSSAHKLRFSKRISIFLASGTGGPDAEIPVAIVGGRLLANRIAPQEKNCRHNHRGTESSEYSHEKKPEVLQVRASAHDRLRTLLRRSSLLYPLRDIRSV